jgi:SAM-dependent methyltransferase
LASTLGLDNATFKHGYNDSLPFGDAEFDAIFSSHCLEHSFDLIKTFREVNRVLDTRGNLLMGVPFGWEPETEHPYFFGPDEWVSLVVDAGFRIRAAQISCEYIEQGYDYLISAQKTSAPRGFRLDPKDYTKEEFDFISPFDDRLKYVGESVRKEDHVIMSGDRWTIEFEAPAGVREVLPIVIRHDWSGVIDVSWDGQTVSEDCYSWFSYVHPIRIKAASDSPSSLVKIASRGKNPSSLSTEGVLYGVMVR